MHDPARYDTDIEYRADIEAETARAELIAAADRAAYPESDA